MNTPSSFNSANFFPTFRNRLSARARISRQKFESRCLALGAAQYRIAMHREAATKNRQSLEDALRDWENEGGRA